MNPGETEKKWVAVVHRRIGGRGSLRQHGGYILGGDNNGMMPAAWRPVEPKPCSNVGSWGMGVASFAPRRPFVVNPFRLCLRRRASKK